jgi:hypothetical protein
MLTWFFLHSYMRKKFASEEATHEGAPNKHEETEIPNI